MVPYAGVVAAPDLHPALRLRVLPIHAIGVIAVAIAVSLGMWQLNAWERQRDLASAAVAERDPVPFAELLTPGASFPAADAGAPVEIEGTWIPESTFYISDRSYDGTDGFWVLTAIRVDGALLPLVRGWTASLDEVPPAPSGDVDAVAWLQPGEGTGAQDDDASDRVLPQVRLADVVRLLDDDIYDGYAVVDHAEQTNGGTSGLAAVTPDQVPSVGFGTGLRNLLYAIEWWVFAAFAAFVWWRFVRDEIDRAAMTEQAEQAGQTEQGDDDGSDEPPDGAVAQAPVRSGA